MDDRDAYIAKKMAEQGQAAPVDPEREAYIRAKMGESPPIKPPAAPPSVSGFVENTLKQGEELITAPITLATAGYEALNKMTPEDWAKLSDPVEVAQGLWGTTKKIASAIAGPDSDYAKYGLRVLYERPLTPLIDAMTVLSLGGGLAVKGGQLAAKLGKAGEIAKALEAAEVAGDTARVAKLTELAKATVPSKLIEAGKAAQAIPAAIEKAVFNAPLRIMGVDPESREFYKNIKRLMVSEAQGEKAVRIRELRAITKGMDAAGWREFHEAAVKGTNGFVNKQAEQLYRYMDEFFKGKEADLVRRGIRSAKDLEHVKVLKTAANMGIKEEEALAHIQQVKFKPIYTPAAFDKEVTFADLLMNPESLRTGQNVSFLNPYAKGSSIADPQKWIPRAINAWVDAKKDFRFLDQLQAEKLVVPATKVGDSLDLILQNPIARKWASESVTAQAGQVAAIRAGQGAELGLQNLLREGLDGQRVLALRQLAAKDRTIRNMLAAEYHYATGIISKLINGYDRIVGAMKTSFTVLNPSFYTGNAVGDALFLSLAGTLGIPGRTARRIIKSFPPEFRNGVGSISAEIGQGSRVVENIANVAKQIDQFAARGLLTKFQARAIKQGLVKFQYAGQSVYSLINEMNKAPEALAALQETVLRADEVLARALPQVREANLKVAQAETRLKEVQESRNLLERESGGTGAFKRAGAELQGIKDTVSRLEAIKSAVAEGRQAALELSEKKWVFTFFREKPGLAGLTRDVLEPVEPWFMGKRGQKAAKKARQLQDEIQNAIDDLKASLGKKAPHMEKLRSAVLDLSDESALRAAQQNLSLAQSERAAIVEPLKVQWRAQVLRESGIPGLQNLRKGTWDATNKALSFIGDYNGLGPIEQGLFRRIVPFYPFFKAMSQLAFRLPFIAPEMAFMWNRIATFAHSVADDPELPDWMRGYVPTHVLANGQTIWTSINSALPIAALRPARIGDTPVPRLFAFWQQNPILTIGSRLVGGRDEFFWAGKPKAGELVVGLSDGRIARIGKDGTFETVVPQQGFAEALLSTVPIVRYLQQVITPYDLNKGPKMTPAGEYKYPVEPWQAVLSSLGIHTLIQSRDEILRRQRAFTTAIFKDYTKQLATADPATKEQIRQLIIDRGKGWYRKVSQ